MIALYGGAFSPLHSEHVSVARATLALTDVDVLVILPASDHYRKPGLLPANVRLTQVRRVFGTWERVHISCYDINCSAFPHPTESAEAIRIELSASPDHQIAWVMGSDRLQWILDNEDVDALLSNYTFIVYDRHPWHAVPLRGRLSPVSRRKVRIVVRTGGMDVWRESETEYARLSNPR